MNKILVILFLIITPFLKAQVVFNTSHHNFGELNTEDQKYFDFTLTNAGKVPAFILRIEEPYGIDAKFSNKEIAPDSTVIVRIKYTPKRKGKFKKDVPVWVSVNNEPITFTIEGEAKTFDINESLACPDFKVNKQPVDLKSDLKINVIDVNTKKPIENATVEIIWDGLVYKNLRTDKNGEIIQNLKWDNYYFVVNAEGYGTKEQDVYVNKNNNTIEFQLGEPTEEELAIVEDTIPVEPEIIPEPEDTISTAALPVNLYAPNNVVFCIDVSVSMKQKGRLDLLKASMIELLNGLRTIDKLAIVTYASSTETILESNYVTNKAEITKLIQELEAGGYTAGGKGIKKAYQVARSSFIEEGNNQVIIATDGAFNLDKGDKGILSDVEANLKKGVTISVVGVKNEKWTIKSMTDIAETGGGHYLHIESFSQAQQVLMNEIKTNSRKK
ncbi:VWA domain-containing protein [Vicingus serpentipes]|jgi:Ca-activated chloride channel homolog|uniref:VWA domain-containing protein n=1 Tax=Vicingus serpentipes TaxID=1926625 RepID=A0A5C6RRJ8_9FLAO|nr:VWA domain-containing protein [Vicingus serpentipes]TXB64619.1 VWA domain-containing protein [Vicingus serpentipes]